MTSETLRLIIRDAAGAWLADPDEIALAELANALPSIGDILVRDTLIGGEPSYQAYRVIERIFRIDRTGAGAPHPGRHTLLVEPTTLVESHERALGLPPKSLAV